MADGGGQARECAGRSREWTFLFRKAGPTLLMYGLLGAIALIMLLPLLWLVSTAFKGSTENLFQFPPQFLPQSPTFGNFVKVWQTNPFGRYFFNSTLIAVVTVILNLVLCSLAAYPLSSAEL